MELQFYWEFDTLEDIVTEIDGDNRQEGDCAFPGCTGHAAAELPAFDPRFALVERNGKSVLAVYADNTVILTLSAADRTYNKISSPSPVAPAVTSDM